MSSPYRIERDRGVKESGKQLVVLRAKWPLAFPVKQQDVRPLAIGTVGEIGGAMGWPHPYTLGVLSGWKMAAVYCRAVLCYDQRIALDGAPAEPVDADAKNLAAKQLAKLTARRGAKAQKVTKAVKKPADTAPADVKLAPVPPPPIETLTREELRARVRAAMLRRSA
jgi:sRNA-binding protein